VERKRRERQAVRDFADEAGFRAALLVVNKRGERRRGARAAQEWYYVARSAARHSGDLPCTHCRLHIQRRATYFVDRAAEAQADEVCRPCMLCVMRRLLGHDDGAILAEAQVGGGPGLGGWPEQLSDMFLAACVTSGLPACSLSSQRAPAASPLLP
jgi:hypothetical protein